MTKTFAQEPEVVLTDKSPNASQVERLYSGQSLPALLQHSWIFYKHQFLIDGVRVHSNNYTGTISEGQSYALLKAYWMDDLDTFERVFNWTVKHMKRSTDHLFAWEWKPAEGGNPSGIVGYDNATDADQDIAYVLLLAGKRWNRSDYTDYGTAMVSDLWNINVRQIGLRYYLTPGSWDGFYSGDTFAVNPSYFAPYVYQVFAEYDTEHAAQWQSLANTVYETLNACSSLTKKKLPPNWCNVRSSSDGQKPVFSLSDVQGEGSRDYSYDAFRVYWRMAMDSHLSPSPGKEKSRSYLKRHPFLLEYWHKRHIMPEGFTVKGVPRGDENSGFSMGPVMVLNQVVYPEKTADLYQAMLHPYYHQEGYWFNDYNDFLHSVIWFYLYALSMEDRP